MKNKREIFDIINILNSTSRNGWLPLGNSILMKKIAEYNIIFNILKSKWEVKQ